jgi:hypothetical protein
VFRFVTASSKLWGVGPVPIENKICHIQELNEMSSGTPACKQADISAHATQMVKPSLYMFETMV